MTEDTTEIHATFETDDPIVPLDTGLPGFRLQGLKDISGTFNGVLEEGAAALFEGQHAIHTLYLYGPDPKTPWWRHWFYRIRERLTGEPYPTIVIASGPASMEWEKEVEDGEDIVFSGSFTKTGKWYFHDDEERSTE